MGLAKWSFTTYAANNDEVGGGEAVAGKATIEKDRSMKQLPRLVRNKQPTKIKP
jgi:hypothetical protein